MTEADGEASGAEAPRRRLRVVLPILAALVVLGPVAFFWWGSLVPSQYSVLEMGGAVYGGGHGSFDHDHRPDAETVSVASLVADPTRKADVVVDLVAATAKLDVDGDKLDGYTLNGTSPGPTITAVQGQLVEVHLHNADVRSGVALHWHGVDVPNAMDGVAGVTQDAVPPGGEFTYRFVAKDAGTYWYHSHQDSQAEIEGGLLGALVVRPRTPLAQPVDVTALAHTYDATKTLNGQPGDLHVAAAPGQQVRVRVINTDSGPIQAWASTPYTVLATDGHDVNEPTPVTGLATTVTAGGRVDVGVQMPADGTPVRVQVSKGTAVVLGSGDVALPAQPSATVDLLSYGRPAPLGFDPAKADRHFDYSIGRRPGFVDGRPGLFWSINGQLYPHIPMLMVSKGDVVEVRLENHSGEVHPMHLHGHHAVVLARNGVAATGSPWWFDSLNVADGETYDIAFVADNPGLWMDHCHNLQHAADGMVAHLMYTGVGTPYEIGGPAGNEPE